MSGRETGSVATASAITHSRFLPTCGDAPKMPPNGGLFQCVFRVSPSPEGETADFGPQSLRQKKPFLAPKRCGGERFAQEVPALEARGASNLQMGRKWSRA